jgi:GNAT acetyltransferase-like protein
MAERTWTTRPAGPADADGILALRRAVFGEVDQARLRPDVWRWQFVDNPAGAGFIRVADDAGTIVGQYAAIPTRFLVDGTERIFAMSCDTMTHPRYQKQGMFVTLARELYDDLAARHGVETVWGFPNDASHPGFVGKLDWFDVHVFPTMVKPLRSAPVLQRWVGSPALARAVGAVGDAAWRLVAPRARAPRRAEILPLVRFDERFDELWSRHRGLARVIQVRDARHLEWRYLAARLFDYHAFEVRVAGRLEGFFVLRALELFDLPFGALVECFPFPLVDEVVTRDVLGFAERWMRERGAAFLTALVPPGQVRHLSRFGFLKVPDRLNLRRWYLGARSSGAAAPVLRDVASWHVTYGDADIV